MQIHRGSESQYTNSTGCCGGVSKHQIVRPRTVGCLRTSAPTLFHKLCGVSRSFIHVTMGHASQSHVRVPCDPVSDQTRKSIQSDEYLIEVCHTHPCKENGKKHQVEIAVHVDFICLLGSRINSATHRSASSIHKWPEYIASLDDSISRRSRHLRVTPTLPTDRLPNRTREQHECGTQSFFYHEQQAVQQATSIPVLP